ncbi:hypothetical protein O1611_g2477 [Lasiodiplodia mahajangana]|uniref:Uncharacterized protein n=1 Tax=Lasiodiplodia mahajangana TaxID=1108764 RepID=A0ACC2JUE3_9PEZI|nr:hypothetical protein O1611_g2477 [Lasiodiplodia mahajangana]
MQSLNDYEPVAGLDGGLFGVPGDMFDHQFPDLSYFPSYSPMDALEDVWGPGNADFERLQQQQQQQHPPHPRTCAEGLDQQSMIDTIEYDQRPLDSFPNTTWNTPRDRGQLTPLAIPFTSPGISKPITTTKRTLLAASPTSPFSSCPSLVTTVSLEDENTPLQNKRRKNRLAAAKCRKGAKESTGRLQQLEQDLRQCSIDERDAAERGEGLAGGGLQPKDGHPMP